MAQFASASFTGTAGTELSAADANWTKAPSSSAQNIILSDAGRGRLDAANASAAIYYHSGTPANADYSVSATLFAKETSGGRTYIGVTGRQSTSVNTHYLAWYGGGSADAWQLYKVVAGTVTQLGSSSGQVLSDETGYAVKLEMIGTAIKLYKEGSSTPTISVTDSAITAAGKAGIRGAQTDGSFGDTLGLHIDDFSADDAVTNRYLLLMGVG